MVEYSIAGTSVGAHTTSDLFSPKSLDSGTQLLLEIIAGSDKQPKRFLDWGCGWGAVALFAGLHYPDCQVIGLDSDIGAVAVATQNVKHNHLNNVSIVPSHGFSQIDEKLRFDIVASNPPTHRGREVVEQMITQSFDRLNNNGQLTIVVEARLKPWVARQMKIVFGSCKISGRSSKHVVLVAQKMVQ